MDITPKNFLTIVEAARTTAKRLNLATGFKIDIDSYTRGLIESAYIFLLIDEKTKNQAYKHFNIEVLTLDLKKEKSQLEQEIDFELGERKLNDFLEQQEEIRATQRIMSVDGGSI